MTTADMPPDALFRLAGGVLADFFDRRRLLVVVQLGMGSLAAVLASPAYLGRLSAPAPAMDRRDWTGRTKSQGRP